MQSVVWEGCPPLASPQCEAWALGAIGHGPAFEHPLTAEPLHIGLNNKAAKDGTQCQG